MTQKKRKHKTKNLKLSLTECSILYFELEYHTPYMGHHEEFMKIVTKLRRALDYNDV